VSRGDHGTYVRASETAPSTTPYAGTFDGNGYTLTLSRADSTGQYSSASHAIALFHTIDTVGVIKNINLYVQFSGYAWIAGAAVKNYGTIENVTVDGNIIAANHYAGGIAAINDCKIVEGDLVPGKILNCLNKANVTGSSFVGGIAGSFLGEMRYCGNVGAISGGVYFGGLLATGSIANASVESRYIVSDCYNAGQVATRATAGVATYFSEFLGTGNGSERYMADWRDDNDEYPDFQVSNVFNYGGNDAGTVDARTIIAVLATATSSIDFSPYDITQIFSNTYYRERTDGRLFMPANLVGSDNFGTALVKSVIKSKTAVEFASDEMAALLNNGRSGDNAPWEYVEGNDYPTIKASFTYYGEADVVEPVVYAEAFYGGAVTKNNDCTYTVTPTATDYVIDEIWVDGERIEGVSGLSTYTTEAPPEIGVFATFAYTLNFNNPAHGTLSVSRGDVNLTSGSIVRAGETLTITATANSGYTLDRLTVNGLENTTAGGYKVTALRDQAPAITAAFTVKSSSGEATEPDTSEPEPGDDDDEPATDEPTTDEPTIDEPAAAENGWVQNDNGAWEYLTDGEAETGWLYDSHYKAWYYLAESGTMQTGWEYAGGSWYYLSGSGAMKTGWVKDDGRWYYLRANGAMVAGKWLHDTDGSWYYLSGNGAMLAGKQTIGGKTYSFKANGM
jgi:hypothetical protein